MEPLYLVCDSCGEAFDAMNTADSHEQTTPECSGTSFTIKTESEAF